ncbi:hypothetical protein [Hymenobacter sp. GOD-10R]|uniref:hypothetical protein n=1 Tax=Hymenobacter sp. GOD-10R TaxID=3093922 RepID=UPI002D784835|nr:hypothetical protein [Hymenobacter sp. GOD-10R]WRQ31689.1 hypothetical protein SD425_28675 [Hymenobacter sp. GOD-10R]
MEPFFSQALLQQPIRDIYLIYFEEEPKKDSSSPCQLIIAFQEDNHLLVVEDAYDGDHIDIRLSPSLQLESLLTEATESTVWKPYKTVPTDAIGVLLTGQITQLLYAKDKSEFIMNGNLLQGSQRFYTGLKLNCGQNCLTVFNNGVGLFVGVNSPLMPPFEATYTWFAIG